MEKSLGLQEMLEAQQEAQEDLQEMVAAMNASAGGNGADEPPKLH